MVPEVNILNWISLSFGFFPFVVRDIENMKEVCGERCKHSDACSYSTSSPSHLSHLLGPAHRHCHYYPAIFLLILNHIRVLTSERHPPIHSSIHPTNQTPSCLPTAVGSLNYATTPVECCFWRVNSFPILYDLCSLTMRACVLSRPLCVHERVRACLRVRLRMSVCCERCECECLLEVRANVSVCVYGVRLWLFLYDPGVTSAIVMYLRLCMYLL